MNWQDLSSVVAIILAVAAILKGFFEGRKLNAETIRLYEEGANMGAKARREQQDEIDELKLRVSRLEQWTKRLIKQVHELGGIPASCDEVTKPGE